MKLSAKICVSLSYSYNFDDYPSIVLLYDILVNTLLPNKICDFPNFHFAYSPPGERDYLATRCDINTRRLEPGSGDSITEIECGVLRIVLVWK